MEEGTAYRSGEDVFAGFESLGSYQYSFVQNAQNIFGHLNKAATNKNLQRLELNSTIVIYIIAGCSGCVSFNPVIAVLTTALK